MTLTQLKKMKTELGLTNEMIAGMSGVPLSTVQKIFSGVTKAPRKHSVDAISRALEEAAGTEGGPVQGRPAAKGAGAAERIPYTGAPAGESGRVEEAAGRYGALKKEHRYTIDDYYALPEDQRVELIDGVFYDMGAPALQHQRILGDLYVLFRQCADEHGLPCDVYLSPCDVRLDMDNYTMVQPDLLVICGEYDAGAIRYEGAPDLVVEILSPSTRSKDMVLKLYKYENAGVREYWIVDPKNKKITAHRFFDEEYDPVSYSFDDVIPVGISEGKCAIDFSRINKRLAARGL